jgi:deoxycytidine triphosphate deaminase
MSYLSGNQIVTAGMIDPFYVSKQDNGSVPSYGPDPGGYTLTGDCHWLGNLHLAPGDTVQFPSVEVVFLPTDCVGMLFAKSTYARQGLVLVTNTPVDGGYSGRITFRFVNTGDRSVALHSAGGFVQLCVARLEEHGARYNGRWQGGA